MSNNFSRSDFGESYAAYEKKQKRERERERERGGQIVNKKAIVLLSGPVVRRNGRRGGSSPFLERGPTDCPERMVAA